MAAALNSVDNNSTGAIPTGYSNVITPYIVNGKIAKPNQYPTFTGLFIKLSSNQYSYFCGATLINKQWILTAAHCVQKNFEYKAIIGLYSISSNYNGGQRKVARSVSPSDTCQHPSFDPTTMINDFALFKLNSAVNTIMPNRIDNGSYSKWGSFQITGFGSLSENGNGPTPMTLQEGAVHSVSTKTCSSSWGFDIDDSKQMCASGDGVMDVCKGDSGGPLFSNGIQIGVVSYGYMPCNLKSGPPVVYGRVSTVKEWINKIITQGHC